MSAENFIDTNVFIYMFDETNPSKRQRAENLVRRSLEDGSGCISYQVVQETISVVTRKLGVAPENARRLLDDILEPLWQVNPTLSLYRRSLWVHNAYGFSFYDSLIVAAALQAGCRRLYTEDLQHGQEIEHLTVWSPFVDSP